MNATAPKALPVLVDNIPFKLQGFEQWAAWRWEKRGGKWTKPPISPSTGYYARNNDPDTWGSFEAALWRMRRDYLPGIGFMFHLDDGLAGVDLDGCRNPRTGEIEAWSTEIVEGLGTYAEVSPSETGLKVFVCGELPPGRRRKGNIEMYDRGRFFTTTGHHLAGTPTTVNARQEELTQLHRRVFGEPAGQAADGERGSRENPLLSLSDAELVDRAMRAANGEKFGRLWAGDTSNYANGDNESRSEADLALCSILAFWIGPDQKRIDQLFRQSGLYREKWERADYRTLTLTLALDREEFWNSDRTVPLRRGRVYARRKGVVSVG
jgi:putative DNA primase/helicase